MPIEKTFSASTALSSSPSPLPPSVSKTRKRPRAVPSWTDSDSETDDELRPSGLGTCPQSSSGSGRNRCGRHGSPASMTTGSSPTDPRRCRSATIRRNKAATPLRSRNRPILDDSSSDDDADDEFLQRILRQQPRASPSPKTTAPLRSAPEDAADLVRHKITAPVDDSSEKDAHEEPHNGADRPREDIDNDDDSDDSVATAELIRRLRKNRQSMPLSSFPEQSSEASNPEAVAVSETGRVASSRPRTEDPPSQLHLTRMLGENSSLSSNEDTKMRGGQLATATTTPAIKTLASESRILDHHHSLLEDDRAQGLSSSENLGSRKVNSDLMEGRSDDDDDDESVDTVELTRRLSSNLQPIGTTDPSRSPTSRANTAVYASPEAAYNTGSAPSCSNTGWDQQGIEEDPHRSHQSMKTQKQGQDEATDELHFRLPSQSESSSSEDEDSDTDENVEQSRRGMYFNMDDTAEKEIGMEDQEDEATQSSPDPLKQQPVHSSAPNPFDASSNIQNATASGSLKTAPPAPHSEIVQQVAPCSDAQRLPSDTSCHPSSAAQWKNSRLPYNPYRKNCRDSSVEVNCTKGNDSRKVCSSPPGRTHQGRSQREGGDDCRYNRESSNHATNWKDNSTGVPGGTTSKDNFHESMAIKETQSINDTSTFGAQQRLTQQRHIEEVFEEAFLSPRQTRETHRDPVVVSKSPQVPRGSYQHSKASDNGQQYPPQGSSMRRISEQEGCWSSQLQNEISIAPLDDSHGTNSSTKYLRRTATCISKSRMNEEDLYQEAFDDHCGGDKAADSDLRKPTHPISNTVDLVDFDSASDEERENRHRFGVNEITSTGRNAIIVREGLRRPRTSPRYNMLARSFAQNNIRDRKSAEQPLSDIEDWIGDDDDDDDPAFQPPRNRGRRVTEDHSTRLRRVQPLRKASITGKTSASAISLMDTPVLSQAAVQPVGKSGLVRPWRRDKKPRLRDAVGSNPFNAASVNLRKQVSLNRRMVTKMPSAESIDSVGREASVSQSRPGGEQSGTGRATTVAASTRFGTTDIQHYRDTFLHQRNDIQGGSGVGMGGFDFIGCRGGQQSGQEHEPRNDNIEDYNDNDSFSRVSIGRRTGQSRKVPRSRGTKPSASRRRGGGRSSRGRGRRRGRAGRGRARSGRGGGRHAANNRGYDGGVWGTENCGGWQVSEAFIREDAEMDLIGGSNITF